MIFIKKSFRHRVSIKFRKNIMTFGSHWNRKNLSKKKGLVVNWYYLFFKTGRLKLILWEVYKLRSGGPYQHVLSVKVAFKAALNTSHSGMLRLIVNAGLWHRAVATRAETFDSVANVDRTKDCRVTTIVNWSYRVQKVCRKCQVMAIDRLGV